VEIIFVASLAFVPVADVVDASFIFIDAQAMFFIFDVLAVINIFFRLPLKTQTVFETLVEVLGLPSSEKSSAIEVPDHADISSDEHGAVGIFFNDKVLVRYFQFIEYTSGSLVEILLFLTLMDKILNK